MAEGGVDDCCDWTDSQENLQEQLDEVMALESIFCETEDLRVIHRPGEEQKGLFDIEIDIEVVLKDTGILVQTWIPYENESHSPEKSLSNLATSFKPEFKRSESGKRWHSTFHLTHLKPLTLSVQLPQSYPSDGPPNFNLSALWLDAGQLSVLCEKLDLIWMECQGMPVIYNWIEFLKNEALSLLCIEASVILTPFEPDGVTYDPRALPECQNVETDLMSLTLYAEQRRLEEFVKKDQVCNVCFMEYPGRYFHIIEGCRHHFCHECLENYCAMHVEEGTVQQLRCPDHECKYHITPTILRAVLGDETYVRWERLCLQKALETMEDIEWCPRCNSAVISDSDGNQAYCTNCSYSFCPRCYAPYHAKSACVSAGEQMANLEREIKKVSRTLGLDESDIGDISLDSGVPMKDLKNASRLKLQRLQAEYMSKSFIKKETKRCPTCKVPIEKFAGCNKVTCLQCNKCMCWICGKAISGYDHFSKTCALFPGQVLDNERLNYMRNRPLHAGALAVNAAIMEGQAAAIMRCPKCGLRNVRIGRNNHIKCWSCKSNICFQCKGSISGLVNSHFTAAMPCNQHGDN